VLISSTLGLLWPGTFGHGDTLAAVLLGSAGLWIFHILIARGVQGAAVINKIVTVAKIVPILTFIVVVIFALKAHVFSANLWGGGAHTASALFGQVRATMLVTVSSSSVSRAPASIPGTPDDGRTSAGPPWSGLRA
jgi:arginine:ornithine antiporter / lysine permease